MSLQVGIVGLPNVGKSTLFNALLKRQVALAANYPFATIEPNTGVVPVPDERLEKLAEIVKTTTIKPATVEFLDIAGLVKGAAQGEGLGNKFLSHIREVDLICHVIRGFDDEQVLREGSVSPAEDRTTIETELLLADLATLEKQRAPKATKDKDELERWKIVEKFLAAAQEEQLIQDVAKTPEEQWVAKELNLLTAKPVLYVVNVSEAELSQSYANLKTTYASVLSVDNSSKTEQQNLGSQTVSPEQLVIVSAKIESELSSLGEEDQILYLVDLGLEQSGLERLITAAYTHLKLQSFLTAGEQEVRAWTIQTGTKAPQAAGVIHSDFEKHFIKAKVTSYDDFVTQSGWKGVKEAGKLRLEGKEYVMQGGDVVEFAVGV